MMRLLLPHLYALALFSLSDLASSQGIEALEQQLPQCALACVQSATLSTGCAVDDFQCHCLHYAAMSSLVGPCLQNPSMSTCTADDVSLMYTYVDMICAYYGVGSGLPLSSVPADPATPSSSPASTWLDPSLATTSSTDAWAPSSTYVPSLPPPAPPAVESSSSPDVEPPAPSTLDAYAPTTSTLDAYAPTSSTPAPLERKSVHYIYGMPTRLGDLDSQKPTGYVRPSGTLPSTSYSPIAFTGAGSRSIKEAGGAVAAAGSVLALIIGVL